MKIQHCRLCKGTLSEPKLKFPPTPLANEYLKDPTPQELFPLEVCVCAACGHYQLNESVDPERLFRYYQYVAGHSAVNKEHFVRYAGHVVERFALPEGSAVLDIASNDGVLLQAFKERGMRVLGIDPAENLAALANANGIETIPDFFTEAKALDMRAHYGTFDLVTANNVFAHVPDLEDFAKGVQVMLAPRGVFSFEVSYFLDVCDKTLFDTIYHEHSSYHTLTPLVPFFKRLGMELFDVEHIENHGGSVRVFVTHAGARPVESRVMELLAKERDMEDKVARLGVKVEELGQALRAKLNELKSAGKRIAIFGVPAKATTLMYALGIDERTIEFAVDDTTLKQGTYTPGKHIPILPSNAIYERKPDVLLVLAWNFADSIMQKHAAFTGTWIVPIPELKEYGI